MLETVKKNINIRGGYMIFFKKEERTNSKHLDIVRRSPKTTVLTPPVFTIVMIDVATDSLN